MPVAAEEPDLGPWHAVLAAPVVAAIRSRQTPGRPTVVAVDGRSGGGKSTLAARLAAAATEGGTRAAVLHTDDVAWNQARFAWDRLLAEHVLAPARAGRPVRWQPPAWRRHGRIGAVEVPAGVQLLLVEGVGAGRRALAPWLDVTVWVQSDAEAARRHGIARDRAVHGRTRQDAEATWRDWMAEELPHLAADRPWERADLVLAGTGIDVRGSDRELVVAVRSALLAGRLVGSPAAPGADVEQG